MPLDKNRVAPDRMVLGLLKNHLITVMTRMNPGKATYFKMVWENMNFQNLFKQELESVYADAKGEKNKEALNFS